MGANDGQAITYIVDIRYFNFQLLRVFLVILFLLIYNNPFGSENLACMISFILNIFRWGYFLPFQLMVVFLSGHWKKKNQSGNKKKKKATGYEPSCSSS